MSNDAELRAREVTQADRDAYYAAGKAFGDAMVAGIDHKAAHELGIAVIARHRLAASERSHDGEWESMRSALVMAKEVLEYVEPDGTDFDISVSHAIETAAAALGSAVSLSDEVGP